MRTGKQRARAFIEMLESRRLLHALVAHWDYGAQQATTYFGVAASGVMGQILDYQSNWYSSVGRLPQHTHLDAGFEIDFMRTNGNDTNPVSFDVKADGNLITTYTASNFNPYVWGAISRPGGNGYGIQHFNTSTQINIIPHCDPGDEWQVSSGNVSISQTVTIQAIQDGDADQNAPFDVQAVISRDAPLPTSLNVYYTLTTNGLFNYPSTTYPYPGDPDLTGAGLYSNTNGPIYFATIGANATSTTVYYHNLVNGNAYQNGIDISVNMIPDVNATSIRAETYDTPGQSWSPTVMAMPQDSYSPMEEKNNPDPNGSAKMLAQISAQMHDVKLVWNNASADPEAPPMSLVDSYITDLNDISFQTRINAFNQLSSFCQKWPSIQYEDHLWNAYNDPNAPPQTAGFLKQLLKQYFPLHVHPIVPTTPPGGGAQVWASEVDHPVWSWFNNGGNAWPNGDQGALDKITQNWAASITQSSWATGMGQFSRWHYWANATGHIDGSYYAVAENANADFALWRSGPITTFYAGASPFDNPFETAASDILQGGQVSDVALQGNITKA